MNEETKIFILDLDLDLRNGMNKNIMQISSLFTIQQHQSMELPTKPLSSRQG